MSSSSYNSTPPPRTTRIPLTMDVSHLGTLQNLYHSRHTTLLPAHERTIRLTRINAEWNRLVLLVRRDFGRNLGCTHCGVEHLVTKAFWDEVDRTCDEFRDKAGEEVNFWTARELFARLARLEGRWDEEVEGLRRENGGRCPASTEEERGG